MQVETNPLSDLFGMSPRPALSWLIATLAMALFALYMAASTSRKLEAAIAAAVFAVILIAAAIRTNLDANHNPNVKNSFHIAPENRNGDRNASVPAYPVWQYSAVFRQGTTRSYAFTAQRFL